ncbi:ATP-dependent DNA ligase [Streptomyces purpurogeneiscleroticus]|uniref:ATP-dependent DNA ligase n=1 Tax=Streptomyces purpurogeneiscleroticus TaxID=68259 RepID=UPI0035572B66
MSASPSWCTRPRCCRRAWSSMANWSCGRGTGCRSRRFSGARPPATAAPPRLAQELPAHLIVFDGLQVDGEELLHVPYAERRARLELLFTDHALHAPWTLCPETDNLATAQDWLMSWTEIPGVEGLIIRGASSAICAAPARCTRCAAGTRPRLSSAPSREGWASRRRSCWAATTTPASCARSGAAHRCARTPCANWPGACGRRGRGTRGRGCASRRRGVRESRWT